MAIHKTETGKVTQSTASQDSARFSRTAIDLTGDTVAYVKDKMPKAEMGRTLNSEVSALSFADFKAPRGHNFA